MRKENKGYETADAVEKGVLVGVELRNDRNSWPVDDSLAELALLAETAGVEVVGEFVQSLDRPHPAHFIGPGKVSEIREARPALGYNLVLFDDDLSPSQQRNLEREIGVRVLDRRALILDIFAQHAHTKEGALQVELAQYEYLLPRLTGAWTHLSRQTRGGVGLRGPGETQLEMDRRRMRQRIAHLRRQLERVRRHRALYRRRRRRTGIPVVAIAGYTNAGKSTLLNSLAGATVLTADKLFATLDPTTRRVRLPGGSDVLLSDTVGFVQKLPPDLIAAFRATLEEITEADLILHVVDITHPQAERQMTVVDETLRQLGAGDTPVIVALNKVDLFREPETVRAATRMYDNVVAISALTGFGLDNLLQRLSEALGEEGQRVEAVIPYQESALLNAVHERGTVHEERHLGDGTHVVATVPLSLASQLARYAHG